MLFQGQEFGSTRAVPLLRRPRGRAGAPVREGRARVPARSSRRCADAERAGGAARPGAPETLRARASSTGASASGTRRACALHRDLLRLRRDDPAFAQQRARSHRRRGARPRRRSCCASSRAATGRRSAAAREPRRAICDCAPCPSRCSRRRAGMRLARRLVERGSALRRPRHARAVDRRRAGALPGAAPRSVLARPSGDRASDAAVERTKRDVSAMSEPVAGSRWRRGDATSALRRRASGWSPTASAATPRARSPACRRAATTACWSPRCRRRSAAR